MSSGSDNGLSDQEEATASICLTDDIEEFDNATVFSMPGGEEEDALTQDGQDPTTDLDELLEQYCSEQEALKAQTQSCGSLSLPSNEGEGASVKKCEAWLSKAEVERSDKIETNAPGCSGSNNSTEENQINYILPSETDMSVEKISASLIDAMQGAKTCEMYGTDNDERKVPLTPISQLMTDIKENLPIALMKIIYYAFGKSDMTKTDLYYPQMKALVLGVLKDSLALEENSFGSNTNARIGESGSNIEPFEEPGELKDNYFEKFQVVMPTSRLNKLILEGIETYVNMEISNSKIHNHPLITISNREIYNITSRINEAHSLGLAAEKLAKYCTKLQKYVWGNILNRCIMYLSKVGYDFHRSFAKDDDYSTSRDWMTSSQGNESVESLGEERDPTESILLAAVTAVELPYENMGEGEANESFSQSSEGDPELESLRDSQQSLISLSPSLEYPSSLPRRSPDDEAFPDPDSPHLCQFMDGYGFANQTHLNFLGNSSQESSSSNDSGPSSKIRRIY